MISPNYPASFLEGRVLFTAFEDWADAGKVSTTALRIIMEIYQAQPIKQFSSDEYIDYHVYRPQYVRTGGGPRKLVWPRPTAYCTGPVTKASLGTAKELYFLLSPEPSARWQRFAREVVDFAQAHRIDGVVALDSMLSDISHTRPFPVYMSSDQPNVRYAVGIPQSDYEGPASVSAAILERARERGLGTLSASATVPHYTGRFCPKALRAMLERVENLLSTSFPHRDTLLREEKRWETQIDQAVEQDPKIQEYVRQLEKAQDLVSMNSSGEEQLTRSLERYLQSVLRSSDIKAPPPEK